MTTEKSGDEIERLKEIDACTLERFAQLDPEEQERIIALTQQPALDPRVSKRDREIAEAQARQLEAARCGSPGDHDRRRLENP
ncbi:MAG TPA: hypothetical protein VMV69_04815 [Pirellulales bacterium]|nr:hypothetical protein [Pirellulales bacterium]